MKLLKKVSDDVFKTYWFEHKWIIEESCDKLKFYHNSILILSYENFAKAFMPDLISTDEATELLKLLSLFSTEQFEIDPVENLCFLKVVE